MRRAVVKTQIKIAGMHCTSCALTIDEELEQLPGVRRVKTNYARAVSEVEHDADAVSPVQLLAAVEAAGYRGTLSD